MLYVHIVSLERLYRRLICCMRYALCSLLRILIYVELHLGGNQIRRDTVKINNLW
jgi:hypothetical protein